MEDVRRAYLDTPRICALIALGVALISCQAAQAQHGDQPVTATDILNIKELGGVKLSPDGRQVIYTVRTIVPKADETDALDRKGARRGTDGNSIYEYRTQLYLADPLRPAENRQLTQGESGAADPAWHPDGDRIAFVRPVDGTPQVFILPLLGGEAYPVTRLESGATAPRWSPDGSQLLVASNLTAEQLRQRTGRAPAWPVERAGRRPGDADDIAANPDGSVAEIRAWLDRNAAEQQPRVFHRLNIHGETDLEAAPKYRHWFVLDADSTSAEPVLVTDGYYSFGDADWTEDGRQLIVAGQMSADVHPDRVWDTQLYVAASDGSGIEPFFAMEGYSIASPAVSPGGNALAFTARRIDHDGYAQNEIGVLSLDEARAARLVTLDFDRSASAPMWSPDGWHLYFTAAANGGFPLYRVAAFDVSAAAAAAGAASADSLTGGDLEPLAAFPPPSDPDSADAAAESLVGAADSLDMAADSVDESIVERSSPRVERLTSFDRGIRSFDIGSATVFYVATEVANPYELYASDTPFTSDRRITSHNSGWLSGKRLSFPEAYTLVRDSLEIQYWIMKPAFFDSTGTYPLLLQIHGGPSAMWGPGEASMWHELQFFASRGYGIVFSNPRGSGGYGYDFKRANFQDWGAGPAEDVLAVASEAVRRPWLDANRQVVTGGSYAGYLTAWIVAHDHRFKAAVAQRGVYDLGTFLGEGNAWRLVPTHFGGYPWDRHVDSTLYEPVVLYASDSTIADTAFVELENPVSQILIENSPLTYVDQIRTPLLIIHGDQDLRTGVIQSEILYKSLKILDRPVEYVRYPDSGHELSRSGEPQLRMDRILRIYEFMERFIRQAPETSEMSQ